MKVTMATLALLGLSQARVAKRKENVIGGVCFDMGDCLITGYGLVSCDHSGANGMLMGILGSCVDGKTVKASTSSSGGLMSMLGLGKRHGPDDDDDALVVVVAANATAAAAPKPMAAMAGMAGMSMHKRHGPDDDEAPANSTAMAGMVMKKRHGPDDDDDVVKVNATAAASTSMAGMVMKN